MVGVRVLNKSKRKLDRKIPGDTELTDPKVINLSCDLVKIK